MKPLRLSFALILLLLTWSLSPASLPANGSPSPEPKSKAASQPPTPTPPKTSQDQKRHPATANNKTLAYKRGTDEQPLVIKSLEAEKTRERLDQERPERDEKTAHDGRVLTWSVIVAVATCTMAIIAGFQVVMFWIQLTLLRQSTAHAQTAAEAAQAAAVAARANAVAARDTAATTRDEFLATHRPRLVVRRIGPHKRIGAPIALEYTVHNIGDNEATIIAISEQIFLADTTYLEKLPIIPAYNDSVPRHVTLAPSQSITLEYKAPVESHEALCFAYGFEEGNTSPHVPSAIFFLGYIDYMDKAGMKRQTAFLRKLDFDTKRFDAVAHPDYEYQD